MILEAALILALDGFDHAEHARMLRLEPTPIVVTVSHPGDDRPAPAPTREPGTLTATAPPLVVVDAATPPTPANTHGAGGDGGITLTIDGEHITDDPVTWTVDNATELVDDAAGGCVLRNAAGAAISRADTTCDRLANGDGTSLSDPPVSGEQLEADAEPADTSDTVAVDEQGTAGIETDGDIVTVPGFIDEQPTAGWICDTVTGDDVTCGVRVDR